jgi:hypothetical protein
VVTNDGHRRFKMFFGFRRIDFLAFVVHMSPVLVRSERQHLLLTPHSSFAHPSLKNGVWVVFGKERWRQDGVILEDNIKWIF